MTNNINKAFLVTSIVFLSIPSIAADGRYLNEPIDIDQTTFQKNFIGADYQKLISNLKKNKPPEKHEFETTDAFNLRLELWHSKAILGTINPSSTFAIVTTGQESNQHQIYTGYNADSGYFSFYLSPQCSSIRNAMTIKHSMTKSGSYVGQNAFGIRKNVTVYREQSVCITNIERAHGGVNVDVKTAKLLESSMKIILVGKLEKPYLTVYDEDQTPTIGNPERIFKTTTLLNFQIEKLHLIDPATGKSLHTVDYISERVNAARAKAIDEEAALQKAHDAEQSRLTNGMLYMKKRRCSENAINENYSICMARD